MQWRFATTTIPLSRTSWKFLWKFFASYLVSTICKLTPFQMQLESALNILYQKQPSASVLRKMCSENMYAANFTYKKTHILKFPDITAWKNCNQSCVFIIFRVYLSLLSNSGNNISFLCSLLIKILLLPFCNICYGTFFGWPAFYVSLLIILSMFCTLFYCHHHWMD